jgi:hypothetical protein
MRMTSGSCVKDTLQVPSEAKAPVQGSAAKAKAKLNSFFFENMTISSGCLSLRKISNPDGPERCLFRLRQRRVPGAFSSQLQSRLPLIPRKLGKTAHGNQKYFSPDPRQTEQRDFRPTATGTWQTRGKRR